MLCIRRVEISCLRSPRGLSSYPELINAPLAASGHREIQEHEAVDDCQLTPVQKRKEAPRPMSYEGGDRHVAREDECDGSSEQAEHNHHPANDLNHAVDAGERRGGHSRHLRNGQAEIFRRPVLEEQQTNDDPQDTQDSWGPRCEKAVDRKHNFLPETR
jgi:hypothetical protein